MNASRVRGGAAALALMGLLSAPMFAVADAPPASAKAYLGIAAEPGVAGQAGVVIRDVSPESPAGKAGLKEGDRILSVGDKAVQSFQDLRDNVANHKPGDKLSLKVQRDGKEQSMDVTLAPAPVRQVRGPETPEQGSAFLGVFTQPLNAPMKEHLKLKADKGVLVARVLPDSPAAKAGLAELDVVARAGDTAVNSPEDLRQAVEKAGPGKEMTLQVIRGDKTLDLKATLGEESAREAFPDHGGRMQLPEGFGKFQDRMPSFFLGQDKVSALEKKIHELENRIEQLERNQGKTNR
jgi:S1-C subfamily serine protease